jgi:hypothetical protein
VSFLLDAAAYYKAEPHQKAAWDELEARLPKDTLEWFKQAYRAAQKPVGTKLLQVPYFSQNDNASGTGYRECFSSSCAILAAARGKIKSDDQYNLVRQHFGDTTDLGAQLGALSKLGLKPRFQTNGTPEVLEQLIDSGRPVAVGWLHKGPVTAPSGGGHWSVVIGYTPTHFILHDPNGEASLVSGGYVNHTGGKSVAYSRKNWLPRWEVDGEGTGWYLTCS